MIFTSNRANDFKVSLGLQKHDKLCVVMDFFFFPTFFIGLPKENLITFGSLTVLTSDAPGTYLKKPASCGLCCSETLKNHIKYAIKLVSK